MLVVVVLPCVPATAIPRLKRINSESIIARRITGILADTAATTSGLLSDTAVEVTITWASLTCSGACPSYTLTPIACKC